MGNGEIDELEMRGGDMEMIADRDKGKGYRRERG